MTDKLDKHRDELRALAAEAEAARTIPARRTAAVARARAASMTIREAATLLGMTEHGLIKAQKKADAKSSPKTKTHTPRSTTLKPTVDDTSS